MMDSHEDDSYDDSYEDDDAASTVAPVNGAMADAALGLRSWGWPVQAVGTSLVLRLTGGFCAVELPQPKADLVLRRLREVDAPGPVIHTLRPGPWLIFLADADIVIESSVLAPHNARLLQAGDTIPLPPADSHAGRASWAVPPRADHRWLPRLSTIAWALQGPPVHSRRAANATEDAPSPSDGVTTEP